MCILNYCAIIMLKSLNLNKKTYQNSLLKIKIRKKNKKWLASRYNTLLHYHLSIYNLAWYPNKIILFDIIEN